MRVFCAVIPPERAALDLDALLDSRRADPAACRLGWSRADHWHLTLAFMGDARPDAVEARVEADALVDRVHLVGRGAVGAAHRDRHDLLLERAGLGRGDRALVALQRVGVEVVAGCLLYTSPSQRD